MLTFICCFFLFRFDVPLTMSTQEYNVVKLRYVLQRHNQPVGLCEIHLSLPNQTLNWKKGIQ